MALQIFNGNRVFFFLMNQYYKTVPIVPPHNNYACAHHTITQSSERENIFFEANEQGEYPRLQLKVYKGLVWFVV